MRGMQASRQQKPRRRPTARPSTAVCCGVSLARFVRVRHRSKRCARASRMQRARVCGAARGRGMRRGNGRGLSSRRRAAFLYCIFNCILAKRYAAIAAFGVRARKLKEKKATEYARCTRSVREKLVARIATEGQRDGFPLTFTRARACGDLLYLKNTS